MTKTSKNLLSLISITICLVLSMPIIPLADDNIIYDLVIRNGDIYNPSTGHELQASNIGIIGSKIERITQDHIQGKEEIDARGLVVSPGFVDLISYDPNRVGIRLKVLDGVTSNLAMHGGTEDAESWYRAWGNNGVLTNFGASSFVTRQRWPIVGQGVDAEIQDQEDIDRLVGAVRENVEAGALGISFSLEYVPGIKGELVPLLELAAEYDLPTFYHLRYSDEKRGLEGIQEVIDLGKKTGAIIHIMHINSTGGTFVMDQALEMVKAARDDGLDISSCFYPYDFWATYLGSARFREGWQDRFKITYEDLQIGGSNTRISQETFNSYRAKNPLVAAHGSLPESELIMLLQDPDTMIGSDTIIAPHLNNHPRGAGSYARLFGRYVREKNVLSIMDAIKKASYFPAKRMESSAPAMRYKGRIEIGADADLTIFDPDTIIDRSTVADTSAPSLGVEYVVINGIVTKDRDGIVAGVAPGQPIRSYFVDKIEEEEAIEYFLKLDDEEKMALDSTYNINGQTYLPIEESFNLLDIPLGQDKDGSISIADNISISLASSQGRKGQETFSLSTEPIIYKENTYMALDDLKLVLEDFYEIDAREGLLELRSRPGEEGPGAAPQEETGNITPSRIIKALLLGLLGLLVLLVIVRLHVLKKRKKQGRKRRRRR